MHLSSENRERHAYTQATIDNAAEVLQSQAFAAEFGAEETQLFKQTVERLYIPNVKHLGGIALKATTPFEYRNSDKIPMLATDARERIHLGSKQLQQSTAEQMNAYSDALTTYANGETDGLSELLDFIAQRQRYEAAQPGTYVTLPRLDTSAIVTGHAVRTYLSPEMYPNDAARGLKRFEMRPFFLLNKDAPTKAGEQSQRIEPGIVFHELRHVLDRIYTPCINADDSGKYAINTEVAAYRLGYRAHQALLAAGYTGEYADSENLAGLSREIERLCQLYEDTTMTYADNDILNHAFSDRGVRHHIAPPEALSVTSSNA